jgi:hypothetical protein
MVFAHPQLVRAAQAARAAVSARSLPYAPARPMLERGAGGNMAPSVAALIAVGYMATVFVLFGLLPQWRRKA